MSVVASEHSFAANSVQDDAVSMTGSSISGTSAVTSSAVSLGGIPDLEMSYHVRVLIPCYKEDLSIVQATVNAIRDAALPAGATPFAISSTGLLSRGELSVRCLPQAVSVSPLALLQALNICLKIPLSENAVVIAVMCST